MVVAGLAFGYLGGVPAAIIAIAVPARVQIPVLHSLSWADAAIVGPVPFGTPFTILCALTLMSLVVGPFAAAATLRHGLD